MRIVKLAALLVAFLAFTFFLSEFLLSHAIEMLRSGKLTYTRKGLPPITVSPESGAFSFYYQVAFFTTSAGSLILQGLSFCLYAVAKIGRLKTPAADPNDSSIYRAATAIAWVAIALFGIWILLHVFRYLLIQ